MERHGFTLDPELARTMLLRQTGSIERALLEAISNSIDKDATSVDVGLTPNFITITDDGRGFGSKEEIIKLFGTFGLPQDGKEAKTFGTFRMGRAQLFSWGVNTWTSNKWTFQVDITNNFDFGITEVPAGQEVKGCEIKIELKQPLTETTLIDLHSKLARLVKWVAIPVRINGRQVNESLFDKTWDVNTEYFVASRDSQDSYTSSLFNVGIHVMDLNNSWWAPGGWTVVSKRAMQLNFARTEPMENCPVWKHIRDDMEKAAAAYRQKVIYAFDEKKSKPKKPRKPRDPNAPPKGLSVKQTARRLRDILNRGSIIEEEDLKRSYFFELGDKTKRCSARKFEKLARKNSLRVFLTDPVPSPFDREVESLGIASPVSNRNTHTYCSDGEKFFNLVNAIFKTKFEFLSKEEVIKRHKESCILLDVNEYSETEKVILGIIRRNLYRLHVYGVTPVWSRCPQEKNLTIQENETSGNDPYLLLARSAMDWFQNSMESWTALGKDIIDKTLTRLGQRNKLDDNVLLREKVQAYANLYQWTVECILDMKLLAITPGLEEFHKNAARGRDLLASWQSSGENFQLYRKTLEEVYAEIGKVLNRYAGPTEDRVATKI